MSSEFDMTKLLEAIQVVGAKVDGLRKELKSDIERVENKVDDIHHELKDNYDVTSSLSREVMILKNKAK